jgi:hypothetical protein
MEEQNTNLTALPPVPKGVSTLVFGIISIVLCWFFYIPWVGIVFTIITLIFGIIAMGSGKKAIAEFEANPGKYKPSSLGLAKTGKILGLVGMILSIIFLIIGVIVSFVFTAAVANF